jgi:hypothetical protein
MSSVKTQPRPAVRRAGVFARALGWAGGLTAEDRARLLKFAVAAGCACGLLLSRRLWLSSSRDYPHAPVADFLRPPAAPLDLVWFAALFVTLALVALSPRPRKCLAAFLALAGALALFDQSRWQPWFYQYYFLLAALCLFPWGDAGGRAGARRAAALDACRLIVAGTYFWGGAQKLNPGFDGLMAYLVARSLPARLAEPVSEAAAVAVPAVEIFVGVALLVPRLRGAAVALAVATHAVILLLLVPHGINTVVWPWNAAMAASVVILFWRERECTPRALIASLRRPFNLAAAVLFWVLPALSFAGFWDSYLSAALYTGGTKDAVIRFGEDTRARLPPRAQRAATREGDRYALNVARWSFAELNVPAYPEERVFRRVARAVCALEAAPGDVTLEIHERPRLWTEVGGAKTFDCAALAR